MNRPACCQKTILAVNDSKTPSARPPLHYKISFTLCCSTLPLFLSTPSLSLLICLSIFNQLSTLASCCSSPLPGPLYTLLVYTPQLSFSTPRKKNMSMSSRIATQVRSKVLSSIPRSAPAGLAVCSALKVAQQVRSQQQQRSAPVMMNHGLQMRSYSSRPAEADHHHGKPKVDIKFWGN